MDISADIIREIVKKVMEDVPQEGTDFVKHTDSSGVISIKTSTVKAESYDVGSPATVRLKDVVTLDESPKIGCGILEIDNSSYPWTLTYEELYYVVDGVLEIIVNGNKVTGNAGDILYIPEGTSIHFSSPSTCRAVYFTYPADWENSK